MEYHITAQPNYLAEGKYRAPTTVEPWEYNPDWQPENIDWQLKHRIVVELQNTPTVTFFLTLFLSRGTTIEAYHGANKAESSNCHLV